MDTTHDKPTGPAPDDGFSLVELLVVFVILGVLVAAVVYVVHGMVGDSEMISCEAEQQVVGRAVESWFANNPGSTVPATGVGPDRYELTLVEAGFILTASTYLDLADDGSLSAAADSPC